MHPEVITRIRTDCIAGLVLQFSLDTDSAANQGDAARNAGQQRLREFRLDMQTGAVSQRVVSNVFGDFPSVPRHLAGGSCTEAAYRMITCSFWLMP